MLPLLYVCVSLFVYIAYSLLLQDGQNQVDDEEEEDEEEEEDDEDWKT